MHRQVNGFSMNYEIEGQGPTIVLVHGFSGRLQFWDSVVAELSPRFQTLRADMLGFGDSDKPDGPYSLEMWAGSLAQLMRDLGIGKSIIMGLSMGGAIVQRFGLDYPDLTQALVILSTSSEVNDAARKWWEDRADRIESGEDALSEGNDPRACATAARAIALYNMTAELPQIDVPTLVMVGTDDKMTPPGGAVIISRRIPGAELHILEDCGHHVFQEKPDEAFPILYDFFRKHGITGPEQ
jgi:pimeloyl-ACP methyl ester carboxylesterase